MNSDRSYRLLVFFSAFSCLMFELVISRLADFHLGAWNSFLALPITFFGLALGSLHVHFRPRLIERFNVSRSLVLLAGVSFATLLVVYLLFCRFLPVGAALGMFYPYAVNSLVKHDKDNAVPITYGISTLASVVGATYAMTFMLQTGFNALLVQAAAGYVLLGVVVTAYTAVARKNLLA